MSIKTIFSSGPREAIDDFRICIDISDRERLHDYGSGRTFTRPNQGAWDKTVFRKLASGHVDNISTGWRRVVQQLDSAFSGKKPPQSPLEGDPENGAERAQWSDSDDHQDDDYFILGPLSDEDTSRQDPSLPPRVLPIFQPGETVKGKVLLNLNSQLEADQLRLEFQGSATTPHTLWKFGCYGGTKSENVLEMKTILWEKSEDFSSPFRDLLASDRYSLLVVQRSVSNANQKALPAGFHRFGFEIKIPHDVPQAVPPLGHSRTIDLPTKHATSICYKLKASIKFGNGVHRKNIVTHKGIWLEKAFDLGSNPDLAHPVLVERTMKTGLAPLTSTGTILARALLPRSGFLKGESIPLNVCVSNRSGSDIQRVRARIVLRGCAESRSRHFPGSHVQSQEVVTEGTIADGECLTMACDLRWDFVNSGVDGGLLPVGDNKDLKRMKYCVAATVERKGPRQNLELRVPITVGTKDNSSLTSATASSSSGA